MFEDLYRVIDNVKALDVNKIGVSIWSDENVRRFIIDLNTIDQLYKTGKDKDGNLTGVYTEYTEIKNEDRSYSFGGETHKKTAGEPYDFYDTGEFFESFKVILQTDGFTINADDEKPDGTQLTRKFGKGILGLSNESINELIKEIIPIIITTVRGEITK